MDDSNMRIKLKTPEWRIGICSPRPKTKNILIYQIVLLVWHHSRHSLCIRKFISHISKLAEKGLLPAGNSCRVCRFFHNGGSFNLSISAKELSAGMAGVLLLSACYAKSECPLRGIFVAAAADACKRS